MLPNQVRLAEEILLSFKIQPINNNQLKYLVQNYISSLSSSDLINGIQLEGS